MDVIILGVKRFFLLLQIQTLLAFHVKSESTCYLARGIVWPSAAWTKKKLWVMNFFSW